MALHIPADLHQQIRAYLQGTFPNEGGGFLIGRTHDDVHQVTEARFVENVFETEEQYHRYLMQDGAYQDAEDYADTHGLALLGYFHSHPNHPAIPSEFDRVHALPNFVYLIVSVQDGIAAESQAWILADNRERFEPFALEQS